MASVKSLGIHQPTGLRHAIEEGILPPDPHPSSYKWRVVSSVDEDTGKLCDDELLITETCVLWSRGGIFLKSYTFDAELVTEALLTSFPVSPSEDSNRAEKHATPRGRAAEPSSLRRRLARALVVFFKTKAHVYFLSGPSHVIHMPFEVETACAAPCGVIIQRKAKTDTLAPASFRMPKVPPTSFISPQASPYAQRAHAQASFSTEGLGKPKTLPLRLSANLENMWHPPPEPPDSHWPRLICLTDPLLDIGLVVCRSNEEQPVGNVSKLPFPNRAEEILDVEKVKLPFATQGSTQDLVLAVTVNRETSMYSVWRLSYVEPVDAFVVRQKKAAARNSRRRSSLAPIIPSGATTPVQAPARDSFGATLAVKKSRKSEKKEQAIDATLLDPEKGNEGVRRQSRRISSLLARGDLSTSQDPAAFVDVPPHHGVGGSRVSSHGSQASRAGTFGRRTISGPYNPNLPRLSEVPVDSLLDELRAGGDFEGFHDFGLEDAEFSGLNREMILTRIHSVPLETTNLRYSLSSKPANRQSKVFVLSGPPCSTDRPGVCQLVVGIQDPVDKRLHLIMLKVEQVTGVRAPTRRGSPALRIEFGQVRKAQGVVDSCKMSDADGYILILSEGDTGKPSLSLQAPWISLTTLHIPKLYAENLNSLDYTGRHTIDKEIRGRTCIAEGLSDMGITALSHPMSRGIVDLGTKDNKFHRIQIRFRPISPQVGQVLDACGSVLPSGFADKLLAGWWHVMQWRRGSPSAETEWSCLVILMLGMFLVLRHSDDASLQTADDSSRNYPLTVPSNPHWMRNKGWQWLLEENIEPLNAPEASDGTRINIFMSTHVALAKKYLSSHPGLQAFGTQGYLPTGLCSDQDRRHVLAETLLLALHLLLEEQKLNIYSSELLSPGQKDLAILVWQVARWLKWEKYDAHYELSMLPDLDAANDDELGAVVQIPEPPAVYSIFEWVQARLTRTETTGFLNLGRLYTLATGHAADGQCRESVWTGLTPRTLMFEKLFVRLGSELHHHTDFVVAMHQCGFTSSYLESLPEAVLAPLQDAITLCQAKPPRSWSDELLALVDRPDMARVFSSEKMQGESGAYIKSPSHKAEWDFRVICQTPGTANEHGEEAAGSEREAIVRLLFDEDRRLNAAQDLLSCQKMRVLKLLPSAEWTEAEYLERQKQLVTTVATSTLATPPGRGLLYYGLRHPLLTQKLTVGGFNLTCVIKPVDNTVGVDKSLFTEEKINWAFFHQGVAAGLVVSPHAQGIDTPWIMHNKSSPDLSNRHAGFLLALGLNGHLKTVAKWLAFKYLTTKHTMTSIGLLLGLAASHLGTMDSLITRLLSVHVTRMLPRGAAELNLSKHTQTAGIMGIGLLYCNTQHRRMSEIMISEMEHVNHDGEEDGLRDEGYRLAAACALGFINLGKGHDLRGLRDIRLTEKLLTIATSTKKVELVHVLDRSAAGAVMAIALLFMKSEDRMVARKIDVPDSILQFDYVRPDILLLRTVAKNVILWKEMHASFEWIRENLPAEYRARHRLGKITRLQTRDQPLFSMLAGLCFALALRFAGSANAKVRDLLVHYLDSFMRIASLPAKTFDSEAARANARMCMDLLALSCATVMAGTGDLVVLRRLRALHGRDDGTTTYGSHLAAHLAIGALFLGCGSVTFGTSNLATAALLVAFYPLFPTTIQDNRAHLQAFRHLWVLATDRRCLVTKDLATGQPCSVPIVMFLRPGSPSATAARTASDGPKDTMVIRKSTPCLLPPLDDITLVCTDAASLGLWDVTFDFREKATASAFRKNQTLYLSRRPLHASPYMATLRALGSADGPTGPDPLSWVFSLDAPRRLTKAEQALVLNVLRSGPSQEGTATAVDARLVLEAGLDGCVRERLLGLRMLFSWADKRRALLLGEPELPVETLKGAAGGKPTKGKKKVSLSEDAVARKVGHGAVHADLDHSGWWLRNSVVEELKGKAWLAARR